MIRAGIAKASLLRSAVTVLSASALALVACGSAAGPTPARSGTVSAGPPSTQALAAVRGAAAAGLSDTAAYTVVLSGATVFGSSSSVEGAGSFDFRALVGTLLLSPSGTGLHEPLVFAPQAVYIRPPASGGSLPPGKSWILASFTDTRALQTNLPDYVVEVESLNPALVLSELLWGGVAAAPSGSTTIKGRTASRYDVTVDLNQALASASGAALVPFSLALQAELKALGASTAAGSPARNGPRITVSAWIGESARLLRVELTPPGAGVGRMTMNLSGFGTAVHATPPPAAQVADLATLTPAAERESKNGGDSDGA